MFNLLKANIIEQIYCYNQAYCPFAFALWTKVWLYVHFCEHSYVDMSKALQMHLKFPRMLTNIPLLPLKCTLSILFVPSFVQPYVRVKIYYFLKVMFILFGPLSWYANITFCQWMFFLLPYKRIKRDFHQISVRNLMSPFTYCSIYYIHSPNSKRKAERIFRMQMERGCGRALLN